MQSLLSAPHPRELGQSFDRDSSQRSTMLSAKMLPADPQRQERHGRLPTRECVHRGDIVALHRVRWSRQSPVCGAASGGKHHSRWKVTCNIRVKCPEEGRTPKRKAGSAGKHEDNSRARTNAADIRWADRGRGTRTTSGHVMDGRLPPNLQFCGLLSPDHRTSRLRM